MRSALRNLAIAGAVLGALAFLLVKTQVEEHDRYLHLVLRLQKADLALDEHLLEARHASLLNYDPLVEDLRDLRSGAEELAALPGFLETESRARARLTERAAELRRVVARKEALVERFKSENATLHNSLAFFPVAASELAETLDRREHPLALEVQALLRDVLTYSLHPHEEVLPRVQARIEALASRRRLQPGASWSEDLRRVLNHGSAILEHQTRLDAVTREALDLPARPLLEQIQRAYLDQSRRLESVGNSYRLVLYLLAILLTATAAYALLWLQNTTRALNEANRTLERRVEERTEDLRQATLALTRQKDQLVEKGRELEEALRRETGATAALRESVAERKEAQAKLVLSERMASLGTLAGGVAHEVNNPLAYVLSNLKFATEELSRPEAPAAPWLLEVRQAMAEALHGAERVRSIVQDLHAFARPSHEPGPVDVHQMLDLAVNMAASEIRYRARLVKDYGAVPPVRNDQSRLSQVALNLLINAAQAIPDGSPGDHRIRVATRTDAAGRAVVEIEDTGCGIPPEHRSRLFEPFFTTRAVGKGTGLGLSICHGIVSSLGGEISFETEVGKGSTFRVALPIAARA